MSKPIFYYSHALSTDMSKPHFHRWFEVYYLISGKRRYFIESEIYDIYPGDMILIPKMVTHKVLNIPNTDPNEYHERYLLKLHQELIPEIFQPCFDTHFYRLPEAAKESVLDCFKALQENTEHPDTYSSYYEQANIIKILCTLARLTASDKRKHTLTEKDLLVQKAATYVKNHYDQQLTLGELASKFSFSKEYFSILFKQTTGFGFNEYLTQIRIAHSVMLLTSTDHSITQISTMCGFNDSNYFAAVFKKRYGVTPRKYRALHKS